MPRHVLHLEYATSCEMRSGLADLRSALPMNTKAKCPGVEAWAGAQTPSSA